MVVLQSISCMSSVNEAVSECNDLEHSKVDNSALKRDFVVSDVSSHVVKVIESKVSVKISESKTVQVDVKEDVDVGVKGDVDLTEHDLENIILLSERRRSTRIQDLCIKEKTRVANKRKLLLNGVQNNATHKKTKVYQKRKGSSESGDMAMSSVHVSRVEEVKEENGVAVGETVSVNVAEKSAYVRFKENLMNNGLRGEQNGVVSDNASGNMGEMSDYAKVKETLRTFNKHYLHFVQEEEMRCKKVSGTLKNANGTKLKKGNAKNGGSKQSAKGPDLNAGAKKGNAQKGDCKQSAKRPDLKAITKMMETNSILYPEKRFGSIPGINVGHQFYSRCEMVAVGFHSHWLNGIDYMGQSYKKGEYKSYTFPLALAIVLSGVYEDDTDNSEDVIYTGQGGNNLLGNKKQMRDQVLARGNLALKHSLEQCMPVRVIRGHKSANSYVGKVYTYDGLYKVVQHWAEPGVSGFKVYKYRLRRIEGQPVLTTNQVLYGNGRAPKSISEIRGLVCEDISGGLEDIPIPATNLVDDPPVAPTGFTYIKSLELSKSVKLPPSVSGCGCKGNCSDPRTCACAKFNGDDFPYVQRDGGRLIEAKDVVFECGPNCGCGLGCLNRTSQRGLKYRFEVFCTPKKGWAVRSWDFIPSGAPICEYIGKLMRTDELDTVLENNYIFDIDCLQTMKGLDGRERRSQGITQTSCNILDKSEDPKLDVPEYCIDAGSTGNIARFINHSCEPNLFVQCVLSSHHDAKLARVMLYAADNIPAMQELTYDYGYTIDSVLGPDGQTRNMACFCGAAGCRKRLL